MATILKQYRTYFDKNNTIISNSYTNTANNPVTELMRGFLYSRFLFNVDFTELKKKYSEKELNLENARHYLRMKNTSNFDVSKTLVDNSLSFIGKKRARSVDLGLYLITEEWDEGIGYDYHQSNNPFDENDYSTNPSNWYKRRGYDNWQTSGAIQSGATNIAIMHLDNGSEDIRMDITNTVNEIIRGDRTDYHGFVLKYTDVFERNTEILLTEERDNEKILEMAQNLIRKIVTSIMVKNVVIRNYLVGFNYYNYNGNKDHLANEFRIAFEWVREFGGKELLDSKNIVNDFQFMRGLEDGTLTIEEIDSVASSDGISFSETANAKDVIIPYIEYNFPTIETLYKAFYQLSSDTDITTLPNWETNLVRFYLELTGMHDEIQSIGFFTKSTQTFFEPFIETIQDTNIYDNRRNFYNGVTNNLYFYFHVDGASEALDTPPTVIIRDNAGNKEFNSEEVLRGIYRVTVSGCTFSNYSQYIDCWTGLVYNGTALDDIELDFVVQPITKYLKQGTDLPEKKTYAVSIDGIKINEIVTQGIIRNISVHIREPYTPHFIRSEYKVFYSMYVKQGPNRVAVTDWQEVDMLYNGHMFTIDTTWMVPQQYFIDIKVQTHDEVQIFNAITNFTVVSQI